MAFLNESEHIKYLGFYTSCIGELWSKVLFGFK